MSKFSERFTRFLNFLGKTKYIVGEPKTGAEKTKELISFPSIDFDNGIGESLSTVYTCAKILADDVGSFPLNIYQNDPDGGKAILKDDYRYAYLHYNPNKYMTSNTFFSTLEYIRNIKGNSFARILRQPNTDIKGLVILAPGQITKYKIHNDQLYYWFIENEKQEGRWENSSEFLHFKSLSDDGIWGINPIERLRLNLSTTYKGFMTVDKFYDNRAMIPQFLKTLVPEGIDVKDWIESINEFNKKYQSYLEAGKTAALPPFTELQTVPLNFADAALIETIRFNADQISSLYRVPPHLVGNFESSKFNNLSELQHNYKINTIRPILRMYRQELEFKCLTTKERINGISIEFNSNAITETDAKTRIENFKSLFGMGVLTPNTIAKYEGYPTYEEGGNDHYLLTQIMGVEQYVKKSKKENQLPVSNSK